MGLWLVTGVCCHIIPRHEPPDKTQLSPVSEGLGQSNTRSAVLSGSSLSPPLSPQPRLLFKDSAVRHADQVEANWSQQKMELCYFLINDSIK